MMAINIFIETVPMIMEYKKKKILAKNSEPHPTGLSKDYYQINIYFNSG
jgi:hypothetical protein